MEHICEKEVAGRSRGILLLSSLGSCIQLSLLQVQEACWAVGYSEAFWRRNVCVVFMNSRGSHIYLTEEHFLKSDIRKKFEGTKHRGNLL